MPPPQPDSYPRNRRDIEGLGAELEALQLLKQRGWALLEHRWSCRWGELDLLVSKPQRLLLVEVKARSRCGPDNWGLGAFGSQKRRRLERCFSCWLALNPNWHGASVQIALTLVPLVSRPRLRLSRPIRWLVLHS